MDLKYRINAFSTLGQYMIKLAKEYERHHQEPSIEPLSDTILMLKKAEVQNPWFTPKNLVFALQTWGEVLNAEALQNWTSNYHLNPTSKKRVAIIMAGNIPLVGFHDFLSVLVSGHDVVVKLSSNDNILLPYLSKVLTAIAPQLEEAITFSEGRISNFDAVIATGSDNTSRYFDYYFRKYPHIIRRNRNSVAILTGKESVEDLKLLSNDIFNYFGLGCRNVSKLYVPKNYDFKDFFEAIYSWSSITQNNRYMNNYDYNKAIYLMDEVPLLENGFLILKEDTALSSPIAVLFYEYYENLAALENSLSLIENQIQCVVSHDKKHIHFGQTQLLGLHEYADGVDTLQFLSEL